MRTLAAAALVTVIASAIAPAASAQGGADRVALDALRDSLDRHTAPAAVSEIPSDWEPERGTVMAHLRRGLISLRAGELGAERGPLDDALVAFGEAAIRERRWPYPRYGLARTKLALNDGDWIPKPGLYHDAGESWYHGFTEASAAALDADPAFAPAESLLVAVLADEGQREQPDRLVRLMERAAASPGADPRVHLVLGRAYRADGDEDRALAEFRRYRDAARDAGVAELELARALAAVGEPDAAVEAYWAGLAHADEATRDFYRRDLTWIADSAAMRSFDSLAVTALEPWLRDYWADRDAVELREPGDRLREHLRRWNYVHAHYRIPNPDRRTQFKRRPAVRVWELCSDGLPATINDMQFDDHTWHEDARRRERLLDDRAIVYMRHGEPARRTTSLGVMDHTGELIAPGRPTGRASVGGAAGDGNILEGGGFAAEEALELASRNQTWLYWFEGERRLFHFTGGDAAGRHAATTLTTRPIISEAYLLGVAQLDSRYRRLAFLAQNQGAGLKLARPLQCYDSYQDLRRERRTDMIVAVNTESYTRLFPVDLTPVVHAFAVGEPARGTGRALIVFAVPGDRLTPQARSDGRAGVVYPLTISAVAYDSLRDVVRRIDTARLFAAPDTLGEGEYLSGYVEVSIPAGRYDVRAAVMQDTLTGGAGYQADIELQRPSGGLSLSDIILGRTGAGLTWRRWGEPVPLNPLGAYTEGGTAELYYELTGATPGRTYTTTIEVRRGDRGEKRTGTALRFTETARQAELRVSRSLGLRDLDDGSYRLRITIEEEGTGRTVMREQRLRVVDD